MNSHRIIKFLILRIKCRIVNHVPVLIIRPQPEELNVNHALHQKLPTQAIQVVKVVPQVTFTMTEYARIAPLVEPQATVSVIVPAQELSATLIEKNVTANQDFSNPAHPHSHPDIQPDVTFNVIIMITRFASPVRKDTTLLLTGVVLLHVHYVKLASTPTKQARLRVKIVRSVKYRTMLEYPVQVVH